MRSLQMGLAFSKIDGKSREFNTLLILLSAFTVIGFICFMVSYISGHHVLGSSSIIPWGMPITITIYLIGLSAGSLILSSLTYVFGKEEYRPICFLS
jgi:molybdopterin-containing oxidoreductase family membrane subunit